MSRACCLRRVCVIAAFLLSCVTAYTVDCNHEYTDCDNELNKMSEEIQEAQETKTLESTTLPSTTDSTIYDLTHNIEAKPENKQAITTPRIEPTRSTYVPTTEANKEPSEVDPFRTQAQPRLLNLSVEDLQSFANALHNKTDINPNPKKLTDLSDVNLDDDYEPPKIEYNKPNEKAVKDFYSNLQMQFNPLMHVDTSTTTEESEVETYVCKEFGATYKVGEKLERGCEETCECMVGGNLECSPRCKHPYIRKGRRFNDPLCFESPVDECCSIVACATGNGDTNVSKIEVCHHENKTYGVGAKWNIGCEKTCVCEKQDVIKCNQRCAPLPHSDKCINVQDPNDSCCEVQVCDVSQDVHEEPTEKSIENRSKPKVQPNRDPTSSIRPLVLPEPIGSIKVLHNNSVQVNLIHLNDTKDPIHLMLSNDGGQSFYDVELKYDNLILNLDGGKDYILKTRETGTKFNFTITSSGPIAMDKVEKSDEGSIAPTREGCYHDGQFYGIGEEFHIGCEELCECTGPEKRECAALMCPAHVGLELVWRGCVRWAPQPPATPPNCCPRSARCLSDGTCQYKGISIPNWSEVPVELTGCEERCFCENGELECQNHCIAPPELPPQTLRCPPHHRPALVNVSDDDCCKEWSCIPNANIFTTSTTNVLTARSGPELTSYSQEENIMIIPKSKSVTSTTPYQTAVIPPPLEIISPFIYHATKPLTSSKSIKPSSSKATIAEKPILTQKTDKNQHSRTGIVLKPLEDSFQEKNLDISLDDIIFPHFAPSNIPHKGQEYNHSKQVYNTSNKLNHTLITDPSHDYRVSYVFKSPPSLKNQQEYILRTDNILKPEKFVNRKQKNGRMFFQPFYERDVVKTQHLKQLIIPNENQNAIISKVSFERPKSSTAYFKPYNRYYSGRKYGWHDISKIFYNNVYMKLGPGVYKTSSNLYRSKDQKPRNEYIIRNDQAPVIDIPIKLSEYHTPRREHKTKTKYSALDLDNIMSQMEVDAEINRNLGRSASKEATTTEAGIPKETQQSKPHPNLPAFLPTVPPIHFPQDPTEEYEQIPIPRPPHSTIIGPGDHNLPIPSIQQNYGEENKKLSVISIMSDSPTSVKMLFGLPPVLVGLKGSVDLRYTDKLEADIPHWYSQIFAPADEILSTSRLEFRLAGLKPSTTYKIRGKLYLHNLPTEPESDIYTVKTMDLPTIEEKRREIESGLSVVNVNDTVAQVTWKHFTEDELQYIDGIQVRYRVVSSPIYLMTELLHHSRSSAELHELRPGSRYVASIVLIPPPRAVIELYDPIEVEFTTSPYVDPYNWSVTLEAHAIGSQAAEIWWRGVPVPTERWVRVYRAAHSCGGSGAGGLSRVREHDHFRLASRDQPNSITLTGLQPDTRCRIWLELFLTNGKVKTSNVLEINTKPLDTPHQVDNVIETASISGSRTGSSNSGDYYGALVVVGVVAALGALTSLLLLLIVVRRHRPRSVHITTVPSAPRESSLPPYDNPAFKLELQQETMDL